MAQPPPNAAPAPGDLAAVSIKLPTFWPKKAEIWFAQAEAQFTLKQVTADNTRYSYVVAALDDESAGRVLDILRAPPANHRYTAIKNRLVGAYKLTVQECAARILDTPGLGDSKPSELLDKMMALIPEGQEPGFLFREVFLRQLPQEVRSHLAQTDAPNLRDLAKAADKHFLSTGAIINAVRTPQQPMKKTKDLSTASPPQMCFFHRKFREQAKNCRPPCSFQASENTMAGRQ